MDSRAFCRSLRTLANDELDERLESLVARAHRASLAITLHFVEVERRKLHLTLGYRSMFDYCTRRLRLSESAANRGIRVARCIVRFPEVFELLRERRLTMMAVSRVARLLTDENKARLLQAIEGKSYNEIDAIASGLRPGAPVRERIQPVCVDRSTIEKRPNRQQALQAPDDTPRRVTPTNVQAHRSAVDRESRPGTESPAPRLERHFKFEFGLRETAMRKFSRAHALLTAKARRGVTTAEFFESIIDDWLSRNDPTLRAARRKRRERASDASGSQLDGAVKPRPSGAAARHVPAAVRDAVYLRDGGRCTYVGPGDIRCSATEGLELDHIKPFALGGQHTVENLRLLCAAHNRLRSEQTFGPAARRRTPRAEAEERDSDGTRTE